MRVKHFVASMYIFFFEKRNNDNDIDNLDAQ